MVLDWLVNIHNTEEHPERMLLFGFIYSSIAAGIALLIFPREAGAVMMVLTVAALMPLMLNLMKEEESKDEASKSSVWAHMPALKFFLFMFLGMVAAYMLWFLLLPTDVTNNLFSLQIDTVTRRGVELGAFASSDAFLQILANNLRVLAIGLLLAFVFGAGAIFILEWNAAVLATVLAGSLKHSVNFSVARYLVHGIPEITAYFIVGLAGGMISLGIGRRKFGTKEFGRILTDSLELILLAVVILVVAALLEVKVSPLL